MSEKCENFYRLDPSSVKSVQFIPGEARNENRTVCLSETDDLTHTGLVVVYWVEKWRQKMISHSENEN